jgi:alginate O-acetyltransferase complex protein AlgI
MLLPQPLGGASWAVAPDVALLLTPYRIALMFLVCASALIPGTWVTGKIINGLDGAAGWARTTARSAVTVLAPYTAMVAVAGTFSPFLYFKF